MQVIEVTYFTRLRRRFEIRFNEFEGMYSFLTFMHGDLITVSYWNRLDNVQNYMSLQVDMCHRLERES